MRDFKLDQSGDLLIQNGDLVLQDSTLQHQADIIWSEKGWWHFTPSMGVGLQSLINESASAPGMVRIIRQELERDGAIVNSVSVTSEGISVSAHYND